jgi:cell division protein FtsW (lipid II flippase)
MKSSIELTNTTLFALGVLSILSGMLLFELMYLTEQLPAWGLLVPFFSAGVVYKAIEQLHRI